MAAITVRRVPIPVLDFIPALIVGMVAFGVISMWAQTYFAIVAWSSEGAYLYYCLTRLANHNGRPMHVPIPWRTPRAVAIEPAPEPRTPRAWPPADGQCFICGGFDEERQRVFGNATHPTCKEWLGDWKPSGFVTGDQVRALSDRPSRIRHSKWITATTGYRVDRILCTCGDPDAHFDNDEPPPNPLALPNFQYAFTCKCPVCENHRVQLRGAVFGHPKMCLCSGCEHARTDHEHDGPHHRNCLCHGGLYCAQNPFNDDTAQPALPPFTPDPLLMRKVRE